MDQTSTLEILGESNLDVQRVGRGGEEVNSSGKVASFMESSLKGKTLKRLSNYWGGGGEGGYVYIERKFYPSKDPGEQ